MWGGLPAKMTSIWGRELFWVGNEGVQTILWWDKIVQTFQEKKLQIYVNLASRDFSSFLGEFYLKIVDGRKYQKFQGWYNTVQTERITQSYKKLMLNHLVGGWWNKTHTGGSYFGWEMKEYKRFFWRYKRVQKRVHHFKNNNFKFRRLESLEEMPFST